jgi:hypothetical protein
MRNRARQKYVKDTRVHGDGKLSQNQKTILPYQRKVKHKIKEFYRRINYINFHFLYLSKNLSKEKI